MLAILPTFLEHYQPQYAVFENVVGMGARLKNPTRTPDKDKDYVGDSAFAQLICCIVALGYQVQANIMDAWSYGSAQARSRIIICITAPGKMPLKHPERTHEHPMGTKTRGITRGTNGLNIGSRVFGLVPFPFVSAAEATKDLPETIIIRPCIPFPDHRLGVRTRLVETVVPWIPRNIGSNSCSYNKAKKAGILPPAIVDRVSTTFRNNKMWSSSDHNGMGRLRADKLFPTITTVVSPLNAKNGAFLHWREHRILSVQEARRAQSIPDHEVLIGKSPDQWKLVGNGVDYSVATALGVALRLAHSANTTDFTVDTVNAPIFSPRVVTAKVAVRTMQTIKTVTHTTSVEECIKNSTVILISDVTSLPLRESTAQANKRRRSETDVDGDRQLVAVKTSRKHRKEARRERKLSMTKTGRV